MNKVIAVFANGGTMTTTQTALWQYDYGQILVIQGVQLPTAYEVHFCNSKDSTTITSIGDADGVVIPDQFLQNGEVIYAYVYLHTGGSDGETEYKITIPVMDRAEPTDIEPTPAQESTIGQLISALNDAVVTAEEAASRGPIIQNDYWYIWDSTAGEYVTTDVKAAGIDGTDGNNAWTVEAQYCQNVGASVKMQISHMIGRAGASVAVGDIVFISDGRFCSVSLTVGIGALASVIGNLHGAPGEDGYSPDVTITAIEGGHRVTITDEDHPEGQSFDVMDGQGGSGSSDYTDLSNKPSINGTTLTGNKTASDLGLAPAGAYVKPSGGIPETDLASAVQTSLGKADTAIPAPASPSSAQDLVYLNGAWVAADKVYIVNCTPTALDYSGTMNKTVAQIYAAYQEGKTIVFRVYQDASSYVDAVATMVWTNGSATYPSFNGFIIMDEPVNLIVFAHTIATNDGTKATYSTTIYPISIYSCIPYPASPSIGDFLCWNGSNWAATTLSAWQGGNY